MKLHSEIVFQQLQGNPAQAQLKEHTRSTDLQKSKTITLFVPEKKGALIGYTFSTDNKLTHRFLTALHLLKSN